MKALLTIIIVASIVLNLYNLSIARTDSYNAGYRMGRLHALQEVTQCYGVNETNTVHALTQMEGYNTSYPCTE